MKNLLIVLIYVLGFAAYGEEIRIITSPNVESGWGAYDISKPYKSGNSVWGIYVIEYKGKEYIVNAAGGVCSVIEK